jgi:hypothetical protein
MTKISTQLYTIKQSRPFILIERLKFVTARRSYVKKSHSFKKKKKEISHTSSTTIEYLNHKLMVPVTVGGINRFRMVRDLL